jgi:4-amino-4-deoxy-L-arabinose transferase-like glycosyltransferase
MAQGQRPDEGWTGTAFGWLASRPQLLLTLAVLVALGPFVAKAFNVDDPLFLWAARQIQAHPANPYGFNLNWYGYESPMWEVTKNPPLACYFLAGAAAIVGWSEIALHVAFLLPAVAAILGTFRLARHVCPQPLLAASATLFTPVFLVSGTTVMCDTLMLAFWVWAVVLWIEGMEASSFGRLTGAALLVALAALTKYFGLCLVPLLFTYSLVLKRRLGRWVAMLLVPLAVLAAYHWAGHAIYGKGLLSDAGAYASEVRGHAGVVMTAAALTALAFTGGCLAVVPLLTCWLWRPRALVWFLLLGGLAAIAIFKAQLIPGLEVTGAERQWVEIQMLLWAVGGTTVLALAAEAALRWRDASACLLALWIAGTFLFAGFVNWTVNGRSLLPMAPAVGILLARRLSQGGLPDRPWRRWGIRLSLLSAAALALCVARSDFQLAKAVRESARESYTRLDGKEGTLWFGGHWGFQYYLEGLGHNAKAVINGHLKPKRGDLLANPVNNTNVDSPRSSQVDSLDGLSIEGAQWLTTLSREVGAGFYASVWGPLPFSFASVPPERVTVYHLSPPADITLVTSDREDLGCASHDSIQSFHCGFTDETARWQGDERHKLQPVYTRDRHLYLIAGIFFEPAIRARYQSELPDKPRDQLKRFTADCQLHVVGTLAGVRTRWAADSTWSEPQEIEVGTIANCKIDG